MGELVVGVDIGTTKVCTVIGKVNKQNQLEVLGTGMEPNNGVKKGIIVDMESTSESIHKSVLKAEQAANVKVGSAYANIIGAHVSVIPNQGAINISGENREITSKDVDKLIYSIKNVSIPENMQLIDISARQFTVDGYDEIIDPVGMVGVKMELDAEIIAGKITSVQNIVKSIEKAGLKIDGLVVEAYATSEMVLSPEEKDMGVLLIDVGGGVTDISVFKNKKLVFYESIPVGGDHISNDISIGLKISNSDAEKIKREYELALTSLIKNDQEIFINDVNEKTKRTVKVSEVVDIIEARVYEIFSLAKELLEKSGRSWNLNAGIVLAGGGISFVDGGKQLAGEVFEMPVRIASYKPAIIPRSEFITAAGIVKYCSIQGKWADSGSEVKILKAIEEKKGPGIIEKITEFFKKLF